MVLRIFPSQRLALLLVLLAVLQLSGCAVSPRLKPSDQPSVARKTFVITGASSGFGRGVALKLAALQGDVVLAARRTDVLGFYPISTDGFEKAENFKSCRATLRRIRGL
ncbi:hypothetical protein SAMN05660875_101604 [Stutzerimonas balearica DSM 6083]|uniref:Short chain dehydrogenase n=1 Tax=Stutzerimonas balearica DSM 6083 TaxID=1123016 RepID=A0ABY0QWK2_9GAMM|nr:hypothetical protein SAMN05660875_101604 [Stutzerimonas balearica DSM 6083]